MILPESRTWALGRYTVRQAVRLDNPAFAQFIIMRGVEVVGYSFSMPDLSQCASIERITASGRYVKEGGSQKFHSNSMPKHNAASARRGHRAAKVSKIISKIG